METEMAPKPRLLEMMTSLVSAYVSHNPIATSDLPDLMRAEHESISVLTEEQPKQVRLEPAVSVSKSITRTHIICLEDGAKPKMLKRYLRTRYGLTPEAYRERWGLPHDYPMVAPEYAERRSKFAKEFGLGRKRG